MTPIVNRNCASLALLVASLGAPAARSDLPARLASWARALGGRMRTDRKRFDPERNGVMLMELDAALLRDVGFNPPPRRHRLLTDENLVRLAR